MDKGSLPFSASVLGKDVSAGWAGCDASNTLPRLVAAPFRSSSVKILPTIGVDAIAVVEGRRIIRLTADLNKNCGRCGSRNGGKSTNLYPIALAKRLSMLRTPETNTSWPRATTHTERQETHHRQNPRTPMGWYRCAQSRRRFLGNSRIHPPGELREIPKE